MDSMTKYNPMKLTKAGKMLLAKAQAGECGIHITKFATGSGTYLADEDYASRDGLKEKKQEFSITSMEVENEDSILLEVTISNKIEGGEELHTGYKIREMAFYADDPDKGEICYCIMVGTDDLKMDYLPAYDGAIPSIITNFFHIRVSNTDNISINVFDGAKAGSQEGIGGFRIYKGKMQYLNESGEWIDNDSDIANTKVSSIQEPEQAGQKYPEIGEKESAKEIFGKLYRYGKSLKADKVDAAGGDIANTKVSEFAAASGEFPVPAAGESPKTLWGKVKKFSEDFKNWKTGVCMIGQIVNNCTSDAANLPLAARQGKELMGLYTQLNADLTSSMWLTFKGRPTYTGNVDILSGADAGTYWVNLANLTGTLPATAGYGIYEVVGFEPNTNCIHKFFMYSQSGVTRVFIRMFVNNQWYPWKEYKDSATILAEVNSLLTNLRQERYHDVVAAGTDWDTLTAPGYYRIETLDGPHAPGISGLYAYGLLVVETAHIQELATVVQTYYPHVNNTGRPITSCIRKGHDKTRWQSWEYTYDATTTQLSTSIAARNGAKINTSSSSAFRSGNFLIVNFDVTFTDMGTASEAVKFHIGGIPTGLKSVRVSGWCSVNGTTEVLMAGMSNAGDWTLYKNHGAGRYAGYAIGLY